MTTLTLKAKGPFSLRLTAMSHGFCQVPPFSWDGEKEELLMAVKSKRDAPRMVKIKEWNGGVKIEAKGETLPLQEKNDLKGKVRYCLKLNEDFSEFQALLPKEPRLRRAASMGAGRILRSPSVFEDVVKSLCGTNVAWRQAVNMIHTIARLGPGVKGEDHHIFPDAEAIVEAGEDYLSEKARTGYRAAYIAEFAEKVASGGINLDPAHLESLDTEKLYRLFLSVKGIGKTTAHYLLILQSRYDRLVVDSATRAFMKKRYNRVLTDNEIEEIYARRGKYRGLVLWLDWMTLSGWLDGTPPG